MNLLESLRCKRKSCRGFVTIPMKIVIKFNLIHAIFRCPRCLKQYSFRFPKEVINELTPLIKESFYFCDICGTDNSDNYNKAYISERNRRKIIMRCKNCDRPRSKIVPVQIWDVLPKPLEKAPKKYLASELKCPNCQAGVMEWMKVCPYCNIELFFDEIKAPKEHLCPTCHEPSEPGSYFCTICGHELICNTCGSEIPFGVDLCPNCGNSVKKGEI